MITVKQQKSPRGILALLVLIFVGVMLNILGTKLNGLLGLPLFLDVIGTILIAVLGGYVPCITVGFLTNIILGIADPVTMYYCIISVLIAVAAVSFTEKKMMTRFPQVIIAVLVFAALGGIAGGALTWMIYGMSFGEGFAPDLGASINKAVPMGYFLSNILSNFLIDIVDKAIVTAAAIGLFYLVPKSVKERLSEQSWYRVQMFGHTDKTRRRKLSVSAKTALLVSVSITLVASAAIGLCIVQYHTATLKRYEDTGNEVTDVMAELLNKENVENYIEQGEKAEGYADLMNILRRIKKTAPEIMFMYSYRVTPEGSIVVFDMPTKDIEPDVCGELLEHDETVAKYLDLFLKGEEVPTDITSDEYGWLMSVYHPVFDENGNLLCYTIADMSMDILRSDEIAFLTKLISLFIGILLVIRTYTVWFADRFIIKPVNSIATAVNSFSYDTPQAREESLRMIEDLDIRTGDELEDLYIAYKNTTADMVHYIDEVQLKKDQIANLQNGLIMVLADMVESRDECTGDHVRKTAAYAGIILNQMKAEGIYADQLTDEFIYDVVNSAPLHDVGKIRVSDTILNKPGKLTDEEFQTMKSHTSAGKEIIEQAIETVDEQSEFLNEARNLAAYHHEKWDGSGYPLGLSGEDIPLSARVMAVADVFDALVSRRSYKEPFSIEKAIDIIREGSGSHFDPSVVQAFLIAEPEIRRVAAINMSREAQRQLKDGSDNN